MSLADRVSGQPEGMADDTMAAEAAQDVKPKQMDNSQMDGAPAGMGGSALADSDFEVVVKPIDPNSPLYSVKTFEELGL